MDMQAVLSEVQGWTVEERLRLIEVVWDGLADTVGGDDLSDDVRRFLDRRIADADANPDAVSSLEDVWTRVVDRYRK